MRSAADTGGPNVALPDNAAIHSVERVHIIRFGHGDDHCPAAWAAFDVKWLRINVAEIVPSKFRSRVRLAAALRRESGVNVKTVPRSRGYETGSRSPARLLENCAQNETTTARTSE